MSVTLRLDPGSRKERELQQLNIDLREQQISNAKFGRTVSETNLEIAELNKDAKQLELDNVMESGRQGATIKALDMTEGGLVSESINTLEKEISGRKAVNRDSPVLSSLVSIFDRDGPEAYLEALKKESKKVILRNKNGALDTIARRSSLGMELTNRQKQAQKEAETKARKEAIDLERSGVDLMQAKIDLAESLDTSGDDFDRVAAFSEFINKDPYFEQARKTFTTANEAVAAIKQSLSVGGSPALAFKAVSNLVSSSTKAASEIDRLVETRGLGETVADFMNKLESGTLDEKTQQNLLTLVKSYTEQSSNMQIESILNKVEALGGSFDDARKQLIVHGLPVLINEEQWNSITGGKGNE